MKIGIYCNDFSPELGGASSLTKTIINELNDLSNYDNLEFIILYSSSKKTYSRRFGRYQAVNISKEINVLYRALRYLDRNLGLNRLHKTFDIIAKRFSIDLIWFCHPIFADISIPYIFTVWDLGHRVVPFFPEVSLGRKWEGRERLFNRMILNASWILTGNRTGMQEIRENYHVTDSKIIIAPFPVPAFCKASERKPLMEIPEHFFFYPAQFWPHKNHIIILLALKELAVRHNSYPKVFFTGSDKGNKTYIKKMVNNLGLKTQVIFTGFLSDEELKYMYKHATAMIFPSLMGPNNLPPIEAAYLNCPIILSNLQGHVEQMGTSALYFDPLNEIELSECMYQMYDNEIRMHYYNELKNKAAEFEKITYIDPLINIFNEYQKYRRCWS